MQALLGHAVHSPASKCFPGWRRSKGGALAWVSGDPSSPPSTGAGWLCGLQHPCLGNRIALIPALPWNVGDLPALHVTEGTGWGRESKVFPGRSPALLTFMSVLPSPSPH